MKKLSKKAIFAMLKNGEIEAKNPQLQSVYNLLLNNCETLNELKSELSEAKHKYNTYQSQIDNNNKELWYLGAKIDKSPKAVYYTSLWIEACNTIAKELGYKFDRHFLISLN